MKYMQSDLWNDYYAELEPSKRRQMFPEILEQVEDDGLGQLRKDLFDLRHTDPKDPSNEVDLFLWEIVVLPAYKDSMFKKLAKKRNNTERRGKQPSTGNSAIRQSGS